MSEKIILGLLMGLLTTNSVAQTDIDPDQLAAVTAFVDVMIRYEEEAAGFHEAIKAAVFDFENPDIGDKADDYDEYGRLLADLWTQEVAEDKPADGEIFRWVRNKIALHDKCFAYYTAEAENNNRSFGLYDPKREGDKLVSHTYLFLMAASSAAGEDFVGGFLNVLRDGLEGKVAVYKTQITNYRGDEIEQFSMREDSLYSLRRDCERLLNRFSEIDRATFSL